MLEQVRKLHEKNSANDERSKLKAKLHGINSQIEAMAERLSELPKGVSAAPIFKQMEKLEKIKTELESAIEANGES